ncbi:hypothetical protein Fmac_020634 [Flemingia macrophylla]|uniref:Uncharacterized protein n=1 Tax=Flemingia macrophylla TaxID=520843 RepID=A0ABD1LUJ3_9FABA
MATRWTGASDVTASRLFVFQVLALIGFGMPDTGLNLYSMIAAVDDVNCVQMGPLDLNASLWDPGNKRVREVLREAKRKAKFTFVGDLS